MNISLFQVVLAIVFILLDIYIFQAIRTVFDSSSATVRTLVYGAYWLISGVTLVMFLLFYLLDVSATENRGLRTLIFGLIFVNYFSKFFGVAVLLIDDVTRAIRWSWSALRASSSSPAASTRGIPRSEFLAKSALVATAIPALGFTYGIVSGAYDYRIRRLTLALPHLPRSFDGIRIAQVSDIHSGSFFNKTAVAGGVDMLLAEKPDVVFFTGDLVNDRSEEVTDYVPLFSQIRAPLGVFSTLGNHDYGDYTQWPSAKAKQQNLQNLIEAHRQMGWNLLLDEHRFLQQGDGKLAIIGVENWGLRGFAKYGDLAKAYRGSEEADVKLLLSHDPSHWNGQVRPMYPDIDVTFSGHTHGMQFGIETAYFRWSPVQYVYPQWAGLYTEGQQHLYVNRGYGFIGFPGRIGILPEITILELTRA